MYMFTEQVRLRGQAQAQDATNEIIDFHVMDHRLNEH